MSLLRVHEIFPETFDSQKWQTGLLAAPTWLLWIFCGDIWNQVEMATIMETTRRAALHV